MDLVAVRRALPAAPGVYRFRDPRDRVLYVGRAVDLRRRVGSYWGELGDRRHLARMVGRIARIEAAVCDSEHEAAWLERNLLERELPRWNRTRGGQEVSVYIGLTGRGLTVVHSPHRSTHARHFGPYLGGLKVRHAVSALHRVLPLAYAADKLGGAERDLARVRRIAPGGRAALVETACAVLDREPAAVASLRAELARRRDQASEVLAYELAARLQAEIEAVDWITAEQKVALPEPRDFDVHGWAGGVLVRFEMRGGRLAGWTARARQRDDVRDALAATPDGWAEFAHRNAELAARLAH
jgi:excinuclease ABC subunit C